MKKKIAVGAVLIALLLVGGGLWYTRPVGFSALFPGFQGEQVTSCSATLLPTYTNDAIQNVEIAPGSPDYQQLLELLNGGDLLPADRVCLGRPAHHPGAPLRPPLPSGRGRIC